MKKRQIFYVDEKFIRKFGMENKSQIVNDALDKYFNAERQSLKNDLQILKDFSESVNSLKEIIVIDNEKLKMRLDLIFNAALMSAYSTDVIMEENNKKLITAEIEKIKNEYQKLKNTDKEEKLSTTRALTGGA
ncbi:MAG: hypothetical protein M0Z57_07230 [Deltaproteobacteria bacterium]|jgi:hypothetical protein|nr:hypothetical protein [Deltaproteobacteria bacterium]